LQGLVQYFRGDLKWKSVTRSGFEKLEQRT